MNIKILYNKRIITIFIILTVLVIVGSFIFGAFRTGGGWIGFPFPFYESGIIDDIETGGPYSNFYLPLLILDLIIYYIAAILISIIGPKPKK